MKPGPASTRPVLSVVIPTKDTRELTLACLSSLRKAALPDMEILVVDDGSRDGTAEAIRRSHPEVHILRNETPQLFTQAANRGIAESRGDVVLVLNSDTEVATETLRNLVVAFQSDPHLGIAGARLRYPDGRLQWSGGPEPGLLWFLAKSSRLAQGISQLRVYGRWRRTREVGRVAWVTGAAMAIRREVLETVGCFDVRYRLYAQDLDLCLATSDAGWKVEVLPNVSVIHHHGATIGRERPERVSEHQDLVRIWSDLLRWAEKRRGPTWAARARRLVVVGIRLHLATLRLRFGIRGRSIPPAVHQPLQYALQELRSRGN